MLRTFRKTLPLLWWALALATPAWPKDPQGCASLYANVPHDEKMRSAAKAAGLHYIQPGEKPGITRKIRSGNVRYFAPDGTEITDPATVSRANALQIPPQYKNAWISTDPKSHVQATAIDAKGRVQYRYHPAWIERQSEAKFVRVGAFGRALPRIRENVASDMVQPALPKNKVLATIVRLLDRSSIRIGNEEYAEENGHFGLTTFQKSHLSLDGDSVTFDFTGKSGKDHVQTVTDPETAAVLAKLRKLPGDNLFQYKDEQGDLRKITSADVNAYLKQVSGGDFTAKDFRTWGGSVAAAKSLLQAGPPADEKEAAAKIKDAIAAAAGRLENTPAIAEKNYVYPKIISAYEQGDPLFAKPIADDGKAEARAEKLLLKLLTAP